MRMQAELNAPSARSTRRGGAASTKKKTQVVKKSKTPKKKSKAKVGSDEDSDIDDEDEAGEKKEKERKGGFHVRLSSCHTPPPHTPSNLSTDTSTPTDLLDRNL